MGRPKAVFTSFEDVPMNTSQEQILEKHKLITDTFLSNKTIPLDYRLEQIRNIYWAILDNVEFLKDALYKDFYRPHDETEILELHGVFAELDSIMNHLPQWAKDEPISGGLKSMSSHPVVKRQPYGTVLIISPWNYPYFLAVNPIATAIAAGNTVIWKPTEIAPNSSRALTKVLQHAIDPSIFQVVNGAIDESTSLLNLRFDKIMLTGSTTVGKIVASAAAKNLTPTLLELGGKSPVLVDRDLKDYKTVAKRIAWGKFVNAGQTCVAPDYILVDAKVEHKFIAALKDAIAELYPNLNKDTPDYCHIVSDRMYNRLSSLVDTTEGNVEFQHGVPDEKTRFLPPTIVSGVKPTDSLMKDELFGPLLPIIAVNDISSEGVDFIVENHDHPLALYVFTADQKKADSILARTRSGGAIWNDTIIHVGVTEAPFGGIGESGSGAYHGKYGFDEFSHKRTILKQPFYVEFLLKLRYPPYTKGNVKKLTKLSYSKNPWYSRDGPVRRSLIRRIFTSKILFLLAAIAGLFFIF
ncbi:Hfd1p [Sugiyamaella lignohabitans]|uniref:Aldehyde dehydrogenase n=1 Tax=Sugiyamaella lignohabitans TaxID=796027 RepID=A0A167CJH4_9ASCO|nr:Hfd1p [Sugiyamaella lignohabitans]ANB11780.1 Hfd1p [Sugiyamaella lignohabitans]